MKKLYSLFLLLALSFGLSAQVFSANFDDVIGTGGNDGSWNGTIASVEQSTYTTGGTWTLTRGYKGDKCLKMGTGSGQGILTTPALANLNGNATLTFRAGAWNATNEKTELLLEITGGGSLSVSSVTMNKGAFKNFTVDITGGTATTKITFKGKQAANSRFFIDDIVVTAAAAGVPTLSSSPSSLSFGNVYTSTTSSASTVTVTGSDLTSAPTYNITGTDAAMFSASGTLTTSGGNLSVTFTPTSVGAKSATLTVTSGSLSSTVTLSGTGLSADNPFGLVETSPVVALLEDFESGTDGSTTMPTDWKSANENTSDKNWTIKTYSSNKYAEMTAHNGTGTYNSWLISPAINLDKINKTNVQFDWNSGYANGALLKVYVLKLNNGVMSKNLIKTINDATNTTGYGAAFTTETIDVSAYSGIGFLAFEYVGTAGSTTTTYQIDKVTISTSLGIKDLNKTKNIFLKNTMVDNTLSFQTKGNATVRVYNTNGQLVKSATISAQNANVNVANLPKGNYVVTAELNGETVSQKILKK